MYRPITITKDVINILQMKIYIKSHRSGVLAQRVQIRARHGGERVPGFHHYQVEQTRKFMCVTMKESFGVFVNPQKLLSLYLSFFQYVSPHT